MTIDDSAHGIAKIAEKVPPVGTLTCCRCTLTGAVGIKTTPVADDDLNAGMLAQPGREASGIAVGQEIDDMAQFKVAQDGSIGLSLSPRPFIDPEHTWCRRLLDHDRPDHAQQRSAADRHGELVRQARRGRIAKSQGKTLLRVVQSGGTASFGKSER
ncbi:hypothetical protein SAE02_78380 [Skermanella aerolata]|uniref:Uncharacterized protein n=1 Tax=Skermanella aerolata TaxID=393310 RepID=A0A512E5C0_9PROT|nr:hypothetical protein N826_08840 [Skermanella aerolata KACC 11604]GEO43690.1 hypothetical protein SAE02_78380 [Skermanella aerolata]